MQKLFILSHFQRSENCADSSKLLKSNESSPTNGLTFRSLLSKNSGQSFKFVSNHLFLLLLAKTCVYNDIFCFNTVEINEELAKMRRNFCGYSAKISVFLAI